jgi:hypothetical protein
MQEDQIVHFTVRIPNSYLRKLVELGRVDFRYNFREEAAFLLCKMIDIRTKETQIRDDIKDT